MVDLIPEELKGQIKGRQQFKHNGQLIYEWKQNLEEVQIFIKPPPVLLPKNRDLVRAQLKPGQSLPQLEIKIGQDQITIGIKGNPPFMTETYSKEINKSESLWLIEDEEIEITLQKAFKGEVWPSVFKGHEAMNPLLQQEVQKQLLLERFQEENPTFDFSNCEMNGNVPDPRKFMGGLDYS